MSAKYSIHCFNAVESLQLYFPLSHQDREISPLLQQSRYLSFFPSLEKVSVIARETTRRDDWVDEDEEDHFEKMDSLELEYIQEVGDDNIAENEIASLEIEGFEGFTESFLRFVERFRQLSRLVLVYNSGEYIPSLLAAVDPAHLTSLCIESDDGDEEPVWGVDIAHLINLTSLSLDGSAFDDELIPIISQFAKLTNIFFASAHPSPVSIRALLHPLTRPPALKTLDFFPNSWIEFGGEQVDVQSYDSDEHGFALPMWEEDWSIDEVREMLALGDQEGVELAGRKDCENTIRMTEKYWEEREARSDSDIASSDVGELVKV